MVHRPLLPGDAVSATAQAYLAHIEACEEAWEKRPFPPTLLVDFASRLPQGGLVLDLGSGPCRDAAFLQQQGHRVVALDLLLSFLARGRARGVFRLMCADIRHLPLRRPVFHGIWAAASLIHLPRPAVRRSLHDLSGLLVPGGVLAATLLHGRRSHVLTSGWVPGRFVSKWHKAEVAQLLRTAHLTPLLLAVVSNQGRKGRWIHLLARPST